MLIVSPKTDQRESAVGDLYFGANIDYQYLKSPRACERLDICLADFGTDDTVIIPAGEPH